MCIFIVKKIIYIQNRTILQINEKKIDALKCKKGINITTCLPISTTFFFDLYDWLCIYLIIKGEKKGVLYL